MTVETELKRVADSLEVQVNLSATLLKIALKAEQARAEILVRDVAAQALFEKKMDELDGIGPGKDN